jgi:hypothetical protein
MSLRTCTSGRRRTAPRPAGAHAQRPWPATPSRSPWPGPPDAAAPRSATAHVSPGRSDNGHDADEPRPTRPHPAAAAGARTPPAKRTSTPGTAEHARGEVLLDPIRSGSTISTRCARTTKHGPLELLTAGGEGRAPSRTPQSLRAPPTQGNPRGSGHPCAGSAPRPGPCYARPHSWRSMAYTTRSLKWSLTHSASRRVPYRVNPNRSGIARLARLPVAHRTTMRCSSRSPKPWSASARVALVMTPHPRASRASQ